jgi:hypothetical protein
MTDTCSVVRSRMATGTEPYIYEAIVPATHQRAVHGSIVTSSGSASEFYIEPMWPCIKDTDFLVQIDDKLVIPEEQPAPRCLPAQSQREVDVYMN